MRVKKLGHWIQENYLRKTANVGRHLRYWSPLRDKVRSGKIKGVHYNPYGESLYEVWGPYGRMESVFSGGHELSVFDVAALPPPPVKVRKLSGAAVEELVSEIDQREE